MIKLYHFLAALFAGTAIYVFVSLVCGRDGILATRQLLEQKRILSNRTEEIQKITNGLELEQIALRNDDDVIAAFARKLGFVHSGEKIVKISGKDSMNRFIFETGTPIVSEEPKSIPEWACKIAGILMASVVFLLLFICDYRESFQEERRERNANNANSNKTNKEDDKSSFNKNLSEEKKTFVGGIPVYDLPQV